MLRHPKNFVHVLLCWRAGNHFRSCAVYSVRTDWCLPLSPATTLTGSVVRKGVKVKNSMYFFYDISSIPSTTHGEIHSEAIAVVIVTVAIVIATITDVVIYI